MIVVSGVRSSCAAFETNSRSASSRRSCSVRSSSTISTVSPSGWRRDADERERALVVGADVRLRERAVRLEQPLDELAQREALPRLRQRVALGEAAAEQPPRLGVREVHDELLVDGDDALVQPLEQHAQPVALALDAAERAAQLPAHALEVVRERAELVAEAVVERRLEVAERERLGREREPAQPQRDQLREHEPDEDADQAGDHAGAQCLVADDADRRGDVGPRAERDERAEPGAAQRQADDEDAAVRRARAVAPAGERASQRRPLLRRRGHGTALRRRGSRPARPCRS